VTWLARVTGELAAIRGVKAGHITGTNATRPPKSGAAWPQRLAPVCSQLSLTEEAPRAVAVVRLATAW
jgi:hypothetical protein